MTPQLSSVTWLASLFPVDLETLHLRALHQMDPRPQVAHLFLATPAPDALVIREVIVVPPIGPLHIVPLDRQMSCTLHSGCGRPVSNVSSTVSVELF